MQGTSQGLSKTWKIQREGNMSEKKNDEILHDHNNDGIDRRGFLKCMAWAGTGALCVMEGGILRSHSLSRLGEMSNPQMAGELKFLPSRENPKGFNKTANPDKGGTRECAGRRDKR